MGKRNKSDRKHSWYEPDSIDDFTDLDSKISQPFRPVSPSPIRRLAEVGDRRRWDPGMSRREPPREVLGRPARIVHVKTAPKVIRGPGGKPLQSAKKYSVFSLNYYEPAHFRDARHALICLRRKVRAQVLHALKLTRSGAGLRKKRNEWSDVRC